VGDHVVLCWAPACGVCPPCREGRAVLCDRVEKVSFRNKLPSGAARLHARGQDVAPFLGTACFSDFVVVAVIGAGGVGLNVVQGAAIADCEEIIAIDLRPVPLGIARTFGATRTIEASEDVPAAVRGMTGGRGADFVFDTVGSPATLNTAMGCTRKGGTVVLTGLSRVDSQGSIAMFPFVMQEKRLIGSVYGSG